MSGRDIFMQWMSDVERVRDELEKERQALEAMIHLAQDRLDDLKSDLVECEANIEAVNQLASSMKRTTSTCERS